MRYRLERIDAVPQVPAWWNVGGTAFHECVREWETGHGTDGWIGAISPDAQAERFAHHLAEVTAQTQLDNPHAPLSSWRAARAGKEDRTWWLDNGPEMVAKYVQAQEGREYEIYTLPVTFTNILPRLALELEFLWKPGTTLPPVKGFIDQVLYWPKTDEITVRDLKSGSTPPADRLQLAVYRIALQHEYGITASRWWGDYWLARKGVASKPYDLSHITDVGAEVYYRLSAMDATERSGWYAPNPSNLCGACGVRSSCPAMGESTARPWRTPDRTPEPVDPPTPVG